ncbi:MAG TPA: hypothetical protein VLA24_08645 [Pseudomonadales bacterium]|nr:hypothetical protein [Pseudomonadales bacterium]HSG61489.1 hypothetical protein [Pseudomonadales bacterium]
MNENDLSLRDYFAGLALRYYLENTSDRDAVQAEMEWEEMAAVQSYMAADAMMAARKDK